MKHSLVLSLCAVAVAAMVSSTALAQVDVALNLRYDDPNNVSAGGTWQLVAKTDDANGIAGVSANMSGVSIVDEATAFAGAAAAGVQRANDFSGTMNIVLGLDDTEIPVGSDIGTGALSNGDNGVDALNNSDWDNPALIASGSFAGVRPAFVDHPGEAVPTGANLSDGSGGILDPTTIGLLNVRGDSENSLGLEGTGTGLFKGDANRDGAVGAADSAKLFVNWDPTGTTSGWDDADFNSDGAVGAADSAALFVNWDPTGANFTPPPVSAVPEPSSLALLALAGLGLAMRRRK